MKTKSLYIGALILGVFTLSGCALTKPEATQVEVKNNPPEVSQPVTSTVQQFTMEEVAQANSATKCWTVVNGDVYDVTSFINKHKGGDKNVLRTCGIDATSIFEGQHGGQEMPNKVLTNFLIGQLK